MEQSARQTGIMNLPKQLTLSVDSTHIELRSRRADRPFAASELDPARCFGGIFSHAGVGRQVRAQSAVQPHPTGSFPNQPHNPQVLYLHMVLRRPNPEPPLRIWLRIGHLEELHPIPPVLDE